MLLLRVRGLNSELGFQFGNHGSEHLLGSGIALAQIVVEELPVKLLRSKRHRSVLLDRRSPERRAPGVRHPEEHGWEQNELPAVIHDLEQCRIAVLRRVDDADDPPAPSILCPPSARDLDGTERGTLRSALCSSVSSRVMHRIFIAFCSSFQLPARS